MKWHYWLQSLSETHIAQVICLYKPAYFVQRIAIIVNVGYGIGTEYLWATLSTVMEQTPSTEADIC